MPENCELEMETMPVAQRLAELEGIIERARQTFVQAGLALLEIRDLRLYKESYKTFEHYCREPWQISRPRAYQLIDAAETVGTLSTNVDTPLPSSEGVARALTGLEPEEQCEVWTDAVED